MNRARTITVSAAIVVTGLTAPITGQDEQAAGNALQRRTALQPAEPLQPIDQRVEDVGLLNESLRVVSDGLDQGNSFDYVYRLPTSGDFMRVQGAIHAVFPQSSYSFTRNGGINTNIPAGTQFYIGAPPDQGAPGTINGLAQPGLYNMLAPEAQELRWNTRLAPLAENASVVQSDVQPGGDQRRYDARSITEARDESGSFTGETRAPTGRPPGDDQRIPLRRGPAESDSPQPDTARGPADDILPAFRADAAYRHQRLRDLLHRAAAKAQHNAGR